MRSLLTLILFSIISVSPAYALTIQASPKDEAVIEHTWEKLSPCVQSHIVNAHLEKVRVTAPGRLGQDHGRPFKPIECGIDHDPGLYNVQAVSLFPGHKITIDGKFVVPSVVMHEFGHWFYNDVMRVGYSHAWARAVALDFADMKKCDAYDVAYLKDPVEAAAQIFAYQTLGKGYKADFYDVKGFKRSNAMMAQILANTCPR